jgi:hypothetical protein
VREKEEADKRRKGLMEMKKVRNNGAETKCWKGRNGIEVFKEKCKKRKGVFVTDTREVIFPEIRFLIVCRNKRPGDGLGVL